jgi:hypothetical protein
VRFASRKKREEDYRVIGCACVYGCMSISGRERVCEGEKQIGRDRERERGRGRGRERGGGRERERER